MANQGIDHISRKDGGTPLCKSKRAIMSIEIARYRADLGTGRYCMRCVEVIKKMDELQARVDARVKRAAR